MVVFSLVLMFFGVLLIKYDEELEFSRKYRDEDSWYLFYGSECVGICSSDKEEADMKVNYLNFIERY